MVFNEAMWFHMSWCLVAVCCLLQVLCVSSYATVGLGITRSTTLTLHRNYLKQVHNHCVKDTCLYIKRDMEGTVEQAVQIRALQLRQLPAVTVLVAQHFTSIAKYNFADRTYLYLSIIYFYGSKLLFKPSLQHYLYGAFDSEQRLIGALDLSLQPCTGSLDALKMRPLSKRMMAPDGSPLQAYICNVLVNESYRRRGIGKLLLRHCEREAMQLGCTSMHLHVGSEDEVAIAFYERNGFSLMKRLEKALFLSKELSSND